jgi:hypothetical protein
VADLVYTPAKERLLKGEIDFVNDDIRVMLVMTNTTADTDEDAEFLSDVGTLDEFDGAGYTAGGVQLGSKAVTRDTTNDRGEFDAADARWDSLSAGTRSIEAAVLYKSVTDASDSPVIAHIDSFDVFPLVPAGAALILLWDSEGILQLT